MPKRVRDEKEVREGKAGSPRVRLCVCVCLCVNVGMMAFQRG